MKSSAQAILALHFVFAIFSAKLSPQRDLLFIISDFPKTTSHIRPDLSFILARICNLRKSSPWPVF